MGWGRDGTEQDKTRQDRAEQSGTGQDEEEEKFRDDPTKKEQETQTHLQDGLMLLNISVEGTRVGGLRHGTRQDVPNKWLQLRRA